MRSQNLQWYEVWVDDSIDPPYVLLVLPSCEKVSTFEVRDPKENYAIVFQANSYQTVKLWLLEDEYTLASGRMLIGE